MSTRLQRRKGTHRPGHGGKQYKNGPQQQAGVQNNNAQNGVHIRAGGSGAGACAEVVCMREAHIALVITTASFPGVKRSITQKNILCKRKKLSLRGKSDKRINFSGRSPGGVGEIDEKYRPVYK